MPALPQQYPAEQVFIFFQKYHSNIFIFIVTQRFLRIELVIRQKNFFISISLRGKNIFLKFYRSDALVLMMIEKILIIELVGLVKFYFYLIKGFIYFLFWSAVLVNNYRIIESFLKNRRLVLVIPLPIHKGDIIFLFFDNSFS